MRLRDQVSKAELSCMSSPTHGCPVETLMMEAVKVRVERARERAPLFLSLLP
jgi:hypothetical protein